MMWFSTRKVKGVSVTFGMFPSISKGKSILRIFYLTLQMTTRFICASAIPRSIHFSEHFCLKIIKNKYFAIYFSQRIYEVFTKRVKEASIIFRDISDIPREEKSREVVMTLVVTPKIVNLLRERLISSIARAKVYRNQRIAKACLRTVTPSFRARMLER